MFKNYTTNQDILPLDFSFQLEKNDIEFAIDELTVKFKRRWLSFDCELMAQQKSLPYK